MNDLTNKTRFYESSSGTSGISSGESVANSSSASGPIVQEPMATRTILQLFAPVRSEVKMVKSRFESLVSKIHASGDGLAAIHDVHDTLGYFVHSFDQLLKLYDAKVATDAVPVSFGGLGF